ncbi:hypothetical protein [Enhygromyxa salina]|uniref:Uncharacterized protein n=1 Tax=Enhygromyxa salina TaxID=215803 RepID=A0A2S9YU18_9BACT|nr:hypothetical protein [Enhygromyxa salina]PRQ08583.1 hypothetical protein ENSA7_16650 [Enhygromyxa salina]
MKRNKQTHQPKKPLTLADLEIDEKLARNIAGGAEAHKNKTEQTL